MEHVDETFVAVTGKSSFYEYFWGRGKITCYCKRAQQQKLWLISKLLITVSIQLFEHKVFAIYPIALYCSSVRWML